MERDPFKKYIKQSEANIRDKSYIWHTAIGLQAVDGLTTSQYLVETAIQNIEGRITMDQVHQLLDHYYEEKRKQDIRVGKQDIRSENRTFIDLYNPELQKAAFSNKTLEHIQKLYDKFGNEEVFGRADVVSELGITASPASELIRKLLGIGIITPVRGKGKGKYMFRRRYHHAL